ALPRLQHQGQELPAPRARAAIQVIGLLDVVRASADPSQVPVSSPEPGPPSRDRAARSATSNRRAPNAPLRGARCALPAGSRALRDPSSGKKRGLRLLRPPTNPIQET